jgi:hypothetical protein
LHADGETTVPENRQGRFAGSPTARAGNPAGATMDFERMRVANPLHSVGAEALS